MVPLGHSDNVWVDLAKTLATLHSLIHCIHSLHSFIHCAQRRCCCRPILLLSSIVVVVVVVVVLCRGRAMFVVIVAVEPKPDIFLHPIYIFLHPIWPIVD